MANNVHLILKRTLDKIGLAIKVHHLKYNKVIEGRISPKEFANVLRTGIITEILPEAYDDVYKIEIESLEELADVIRDLEGSEGKILVSKLEQRIINIIIRLNSPDIKLSEQVILIDDDQIQGSEQFNKPSVSLKYQYVLLDDEQVDFKSESLDKPEVFFDRISVLIDNDKIPGIESEGLSKPNIYLTEISFNVVDGEIVYSDILPSPSITLNYTELQFEDDVFVKSVELDIPLIELFSFEKVSDELVDSSTSVSLNEPLISYLEFDKVSDTIENETSAKQLRQPSLKLFEIYFNENGEDYVTPVISKPYIHFTEVYVSNDDDVVVTTPHLSKPSINFKEFSVYLEPDITQDKEKLSVPTISLLNLSIYIEDSIGSYKVPLEKPSVELLDIDFETSEILPGTTKLSTPLIQFIEKDKLDIPLPCVPEKLSKPEIEITNLYVERQEEEEISQEILIKPDVDLIELSYFFDYDDFPESVQLSAPNIRINFVMIDVVDIIKPNWASLNRPQLDLIELEPSFDEIVEWNSSIINTPNIGLTYGYPEKSTDSVDGYVKLPVPSISLFNKTVFVDEFTSQSSVQFNSPFVKLAEVHVYDESEDFESTVLSKPDILLNSAYVTIDDYSFGYNVLNKPEIELFEIIYSKSSAVLNIAILGYAVLGTK